MSRCCDKYWNPPGGDQMVAPAKKRPAGPLASDDVPEEENRQLRVRIRELGPEREILRRAARYFAGETNW